MNTNKYYELSGNYEISGVIKSLFIALLFSTFAAALYGYAFAYIPFRFSLLKIFITFGFSFSIGYLVSLGGEFGKIRNRGIVILIGVIVASYVEYIQWVSYVFAYFKHKYLIFDIEALLKFIVKMPQLGDWKMKGLTLKNGLLYTIWISEYIVLLGGTIYYALSMFRIKVFCEHCESWAKDDTIISNLGLIKDKKELKLQLESGDFSQLENLKEVSDEEEVYTELSLLRCHSCTQLFTLTVRDVSIVIDKKGNKNKIIFNILSNLIISIVTYDKLIKLKEKNKSSEENTPFKW